MARRDESILIVLARLPWWVSVCFAAVVYAGLKFVLPFFASNYIILKGIAPLASQYAWVAAIFLIPAAVSAFGSFRKSRQLDRQNGIESIRSLDWKQFEELLGEAYRRQGYSVKENSSAGPDGGIDLTIKQDGNVYLVQCKQWRNFKVGVKVVREMLGLVTAHGAQGTIIVTSGTFTQEAKAFASGKPIELVEGHQLVGMIGSVQIRPMVAVSDTMGQTRPVDAHKVQPIASVRQCPRCGGEMVVRKARRGATAGSRFLGCSGYPKCRYTEGYEG